MAWCFPLAGQGLDGCSCLLSEYDLGKDGEMLNYQIALGMRPCSCSFIFFGVSFPTSACSERAGSNLSPSGVDLSP